MKKYLGFLITMLLAFSFLMVPVRSEAIPLSEVGGVDDLIDQIYLANSGDDTELDWVQSVIGEDYVIIDKIENPNEEGLDYDDPEYDNWGWESVDNTPYTWAHSVSEDTEYFLVKTGNLKDLNSNNTFLFENLASFNWATVSLMQFISDSYDGKLDDDIQILNVGKLSHLDVVNPVPEPATMLLLGSGLIGLAGFRRKFKK